MNWGAVLLMVLFSEKTIVAQSSISGATIHIVNGDNAATNDVPNAVDHYTKAITIDPSNAEAYMKRARVMTIMGRFAEAQQDYNMAIKLNPATVILYNERAKLEILAQDYKSARNDIDYALSISPHKKLLLDQRFDIEMESNNYEQALENIITIVEEDTADLMARVKLAIVYLNLNLPDSAVFTLNEAIRKDEQNYVAHDVKGLALLKQKKYQEAIQSFSTALKIHPDFAIGYVNRAVAHKATGNTIAYTEDLKKAIETDRSVYQAYFLKGLQSKNNKQFYDAVQYLSASISEGDTSGYSYFARGYSKKMLGNYADALNDFTTAIQNNSADYKAYLNRGNVYMIFGEYQKAIDDYTSAIQINNDYAEAYFNRGIAYIVKFNRQLGCDDLKTSAGLNYQQAKEKLSFFCQ